MGGDWAARLADERRQAVDRVAARTSDVEVIVAAADSTTGDDEHDPEGATIGFERAQALALLDRAREHLRGVEAAQDRLADGRFGTCADCGEPIGADRLEARPTATSCLTCSSRARRRARP